MQSCAKAPLESKDGGLTLTVSKYLHFLLRKMVSLFHNLLLSIQTVPQASLFKTPKTKRVQQLFFTARLKLKHLTRSYLSGVEDSLCIRPI